MGLLGALDGTACAGRCGSGLSGCNTEHILILGGCWCAEDRQRGRVGGGHVLQGRLLQHSEEDAAEAM